MTPFAGGLIICQGAICFFAMLREYQTSNATCNIVVRQTSDSSCYYYYYTDQLIPTPDALSNRLFFYPCTVATLLNLWKERTEPIKHSYYCYYYYYYHLPGVRYEATKLIQLLLQVYNYHYYYCCYYCCSPSRALPNKAETFPS